MQGRILFCWSMCALSALAYSLLGHPEWAVPFVAAMWVIWALDERTDRGEHE